MHRRQADENMAFCFPGDPGSSSYEKARAAEISEACKKFDVTIDLHNINGHGANTAQIYPERGVSPEVLGFLRATGIGRLILADYHGVLRHVPNAIVMERVRGADGVDPVTFRHALFRLANGPEIPRARAADFRWFHLLDDSPHENRAGPDCLAAVPGLQAFEPLPAALAARLMDDPPAGLGLMGWLDEPNENGYWTEMVVPAQAPDDSSWPRWPSR